MYSGDPKDPEIRKFGLNALVITAVVSWSVGLVVGAMLVVGTIMGIGR